ncbi:MAG: beta-galactosidase [Dehalococcoidia bacterium]
MTAREAAPGASSPAPGVGDARIRRRAFVAFCVLGGGATIALGMVAFMAWLFIRLSWPHVEPAGDPVFGVSFSCNQMEYLELEDPTLGRGAVPDDRPGRAEWCAARLSDLLAATGAPIVRISAEWSEVEPAPGRYDFTLLDALLGAAERNGAKVLLTVGMKAQRHPEWYIPGWMTDRTGGLEGGETISDVPELRAGAIAMAAAVVRHASQSPAIDAWGADNEPFVVSARGEHWQDWRLGRDYITELVTTIHANDPAGRPVSVNHGQHFVMDRRWRWALEAGDVLATSIYPFRNDSILGRPVVLPILEIGPLAPNYAHQARSAHDAGKGFWITELQGEPWTDYDVHLVSPANPSPNLDVRKFERNLEYARRSGADRAYLWGGEWWLYQRDRYGDDSWLIAAAAAMKE